MQPAARLLINVDDKDKSYILWNGTETYYKKLRLAYLDIVNNQQSEYLHFGFFTLCAATLEYSLNFILTDFCVKKFGISQYKSYAEGYINISFAKKLLMTPNIISGGHLILKEENSAYKILLDLISLRNKILHNKEFLKEFDFSFILETDTKEEIEFQIEVNPNHIDTLTKDKCITFGKAMNDFKKFILNPALTHELIENEMMHKT